MHRVRIKDLKQYAKAIEVLTRVGGTFHGVGHEEWFLLVTDPQYQALVQAKVVTSDNGAKEANRGARSQNKARP